jgi:hypothetical protein
MSNYLQRTIQIIDAATEYIKTASENEVYDQIDDAFIKIANDTFDNTYKVAHLVAHTIGALGLTDKVDTEDFIKTAAVAETIYTKLANSDNLMERDLAETAKYHINAIFVKLGEIAKNR